MVVRFLMLSLFIFFLISGRGVLIGLYFFLGGLCYRVGMDSLLQALRGFFRRTHLAALNQGQLAVMVSLADREQTCMVIATETGYDRSTVRQILQRLKQVRDVEMRPFRSSGHGQVEYVYKLTDKGQGVMKRCLGEFDGLMARLALMDNPAALKDVLKKLEEREEGKPGEAGEEKASGAGKGKKDAWLC